MDFCWEGAWEGGHKLKSKTKTWAAYWIGHQGMTSFLRQVALCERDGRPGPQPQWGPRKAVNWASKTCLLGRLWLLSILPYPLFPRLVNNIPDGLQSMGVWDIIHWFKSWASDIPGWTIRSFLESPELEWRHTEVGGVCSWATEVSTLVPLTLWAR